MKKFILCGFLMLLAAWLPNEALADIDVGNLQTPPPPIVNTDNTVVERVGTGTFIAPISQLLVPSLFSPSSTSAATFGGSYPYKFPLGLTVSGGTLAAAAVTATSLTDSALTSGDCLQASTGGLITTTSSACGSGGGGSVTSVSAGTDIVVTGSTAAPVVSVTAAPSFTSVLQSGTNETTCFICYGTTGTSSTAVLKFGNAISSGFTSLGAPNAGTISGVQDSVFGLGSNGTRMMALDGSGDAGFLGYVEAANFTDLGLTASSSIVCTTSGNVLTTTGCMTRSQQAFDTVSVGPSEPITTVVARIPLTQNVTISKIAVVFNAQAGTAPTVNVAYFTGNETVGYTGTVPANGANATAGQTLFTSGQTLSTTPGYINTINAPSPTAIWPAGGELVELISTGSGGGLGNLKMTLAP